MKDNGKWHRCTDCSGLWLTGRAVRESLGQQTSTNIALTMKRQGQPTALCCPKDGKSLQEITVKGVTVDCCATCNGVWFDAGELDVMRRNTTSKSKRAVSSAMNVLDGITSGFDILEGLAAIF